MKNEKRIRKIILRRETIFLRRKMMILRRETMILSKEEDDDFYNRYV